jgi:hypothetical protein
VHGDDLHQILIALKALLMSLVVIVGLARLGKGPERFRRSPAGAVKAL